MKRALALLKRLWRFIFPGPAMRWDWKAADLRDEWHTEAEIVEILGPRPDADD